MIDARELRIGNWVKFDNLFGKERYISVTPRFFPTLAAGGSFEEQASDTVLNEYWHPIPLTAEILEKCGFYQNDELTWFPYWQIKHTRINELVEYTFRISTIGDNEWRWIEGNVNVPIYYVHQLQNLYYALTGTELEITL